MVAAENRAVINAVGLTKVFRDFWNRPKAKAVNDIDFQINEGEVVGLLGPNGSGKSTTVKMILGLLYPTGGKLTVMGKSPLDVSAKKDIGYLPEETYLYKYLTAFETLDFFGSLFNLSGAERKRRAAQLLDMVGLEHAAHRQVGEFSKGMARRIGLAQAMINDPSLLILDEPTSGLDPLGCREVKDLILTLKKRGKTVLVTSHLLSDVQDVCDRVIILYGGKIRASGPLSELLTVHGESLIKTQKPDITEKIINILKETVGSAEFSVEHPKRTLEEFFLDIVSRAKSESVETSGVSGGGKIADYLTEPAEKSAAELLGGLVNPKEAERPAAEKEEEPAPPSHAPSEKLKELTGEKEKPLPEPEVKTGAKEDFSDINKKLDSLISENIRKKD
jgi:ABC-2 type transport system ATP-binding protein